MDKYRLSLVTAILLSCSGDLTGMDELEYETQFFGFNPKAFADAVYNAKYDYVHNAIRVLLEFLTAQFPNVDRQRLLEGSQQLRTEILKSAEKICDKLEVYLSRNILVIPRHVVLPEDAVHAHDDAVATDDRQLDDELLQLDCKITSTASSVCDLASKKTKLESAIDSYRSTLRTTQQMDLIQHGDIEEAVDKVATESANLFEAVQHATQHRRGPQ